MKGRTSSAGVPLDDLPAGLIGRLTTLPVDLYLRNAGNLVLYAQSGSDAAMLRRPDLAGRFWVTWGDLSVIRATLPDALASTLAERPADPVGAYRDAYRLLVETLEPVFVRGTRPEGIELGLVEAALDVVVDHHRAVPEAADAALAVLRRRHDWVYDALNTCLLSVVLAAALGLERDELRVVASGAFFHDLGMTQIPLALTEHPGPLDPRQLARIRQHPTIGVSLLEDVLGEAPAYAVIVRDHHERLDGSGYPARSRAGEIGLTAQIVGIADTWEAMTARRPHRAPADFAAAEQWLLDPSAGFDLRLTELFVGLVARR